MENNRERNSESGAEGDKIPKLGKPKQKNQSATDGEDEPDEPGANRKLVHTDTGVTIFAHKHLTVMPLIIAPIRLELKHASKTNTSQHDIFCAVIFDTR